jgi:alpha-beta hydrolase superfamily lysophospholipase
MQRIVVAGKWLGITLVVLVLAVYFLRAFGSRSMPPLGPEHRIEFANEFDASMEADTDWDAYLAIEDRLAAELDEKIPSASRAGSPADRYFAGCQTWPGRFGGNWNRSWELAVPSPRGVAVLLHGLTDSPYSMLATGESLAAAGYNVVTVRMPGHGFAVGGLKQANSEDWQAAVRIAVRRAMQRPGAEQSFLLAGYSNGALLAVDYALHCDSAEELPCPDSLVLLSPAIAVRRAAAIMNLHTAISWMPYFEKFAWLEILPEIDPFKFTSFPKHAAWEIYRLARRVNRELAIPERAGGLPPVLTFLSAVDYTVDTKAVVASLYDRLPENGSRLVVYDVNRNSTMLPLMKTIPPDPADTLLARAPLHYGVTILKNRDASTNAVDAGILDAGSTEPRSEETSLRWPTQVYSLSHIAIPFRADDAIYGDGSMPDAASPDVTFGAMAPRGERNVLQLPPDYFLRMRYNPFFPFQSRVLTEWLDTHRHH